MKRQKVVFSLLKTDQMDFFSRKKEKILLFSLSNYYVKDEFVPLNRMSNTLVFENCVISTPA